MEYKRIKYQELVELCHVRISQDGDEVVAVGIMTSGTHWEDRKEFLHSILFVI